MHRQHVCDFRKTPPHVFAIRLKVTLLFTPGQNAEFYDNKRNNLNSNIFFNLTNVLE